MRSTFSGQARAGVAVGLILMVAGTAQGGVYRFLPRPLNLDGLILQSYTGEVQNFNQPVVVNGQVIGTIRLDYNTYLAAVPNPFTFVGGAGLAGGFFAAPGLRAEGEIGWIQTVTATVSGENIWNAPNGSEFPDTLNGLNPDYTMTRLPDGRMLPQPSVGFQDFPFRKFDQNQTFLAELGLACKGTMPNPEPGGPPLQVAHIIGTLLWGFEVDAADATIVPFGPRAWGPPTPTYLITLGTHFNGQTRWHDIDDPTKQFTSGDWVFDENAAGCFTLVPEPSTFTLLTLGSLGLLGYGWRRRKRAAA